jgi:hypothetical protein
VARDGIFAIHGDPSQAGSFLLLYPWSGGEPVRVGALTRPVLPGLSVSPDGLTVLFTQTDRDDVNLMLVENFH